MRFRRELSRHQREYREQTEPRNPPPMLRYRVHHSFDEHSYEEMGAYLAKTIVDTLRNAGVDLDDREVLDFACGPGRVIRDFHRLVPAARLTGTDIDGEAIGWARSNLGHVAEFCLNRETPPTMFADASFDVIYSISLFTHLDESSQDAWLKELSRLLRSGGLLLTTVHGRFAAGSCTDQERAELSRAGMAFRVDRKGRFKLDGLPDFYQTTFHTREYVERHWSQFLDVLSYAEGGVHEHQDLILLVKR